MIPIHELRIGNKIIGIYDEENKLSEECEVVCLDDTDEITDYPIWIDRRKEDAYDEFKPIPLTEEWLIKFGFERTTRISDLNIRKPVWANCSFTLTIWEDGRLFYDWIGGNIEVKYIHHLQNIYRDLLNEELTIKQ